MVMICVDNSTTPWLVDNYQTVDIKVEIVVGIGEWGYWFISVDAMVSIRGWLNLVVVTGYQQQLWTITNWFCEAFLGFPYLGWSGPISVRFLGDFDGWWRSRYISTYINHWMISIWMVSIMIRGWSHWEYVYFSLSLSVNMRIHRPTTAVCWLMHLLSTQVVIFSCSTGIQHTE